MKKEIVLVTSIAPKNIENQQEAIGSWIANGFRVISCNVIEELESIQRYFPDVEFVELSRHAAEVIGKPCPYIYDLLQILKAKADAVCGIVNSDIHIRGISEEFFDFVRESAETSVVFARRQEVEKAEDMHTLDSCMFLGGVDLFLFHREMINAFEDDGLILGQAMWDYWLPIMAKEHGIPLKELVNPVLFHIKHAFQWDDGVTDVISKNICQKHFKNVDDDEAVFFLKDRFFALITEADKICYVTEDMKKRRVLVVGKEEDAYGNRLELGRQTHKNITYAGEQEALIQNLPKQYEYVIYLPYRVWMTEAFVSAIIWIMESYRIHGMRMHVYLRGNVSKAVKIGNCNEKMLLDFNEDLPPLAIYKAGAAECSPMDMNALLKPCRICLGGVWSEEDTGVIWRKQKTEGKVYIFPAGYMARRWVKEFRDVAEEIEIEGFIDNNSDMEGRVFHGVRVYDVNVLKQVEQYDKVLIVTNLYTDKIYEQLLNMIPKEKIIIWKNEFDAQLWMEIRNQIKVDGRPEVE